jgi:putative FmdB family regulatory protein
VPTYVYACKNCDERQEVVQSMTAAPLTQCEKCGGSLRRVIFPPAIVYKGSGFYTTDYKNGGRKADSESAPSTGEGAESKTESKSENKTDSKSETKSESKSESKSDSKSDGNTETKKEAASTS